MPQRHEKLCIVDDGERRKPPSVPLAAAAAAKTLVWLCSLAYELAHLEGAVAVRTTLSRSDRRHF